MTLGRRKPRCWLAQFADSPCDGRIDAVHLIPRQLLRREAPIADLWDPRLLRPACRFHHGALDVARSIRVPRSALPEGVEDFASEHGLEFWLAREYGEHEAAA